MGVLLVEEVEEVERVKCKGKGLPTQLMGLQHAGPHGVTRHDVDAVLSSGRRHARPAFHLVESRHQQRQPLSAGNQSIHRASAGEHIQLHAKHHRFHPHGKAVA